MWSALFAALSAIVVKAFDYIAGSEKREPVPEPEAPDVPEWERIEAEEDRRLENARKRGDGEP